MKKLERVIARVKYLVGNICRRSAGMLSRHKIAIGLVVVVLLAISMQVLSFHEMGVTSEMGSVTPLTIEDISSLPQIVIDDATAVANDLYGDYLEKRDSFANQLMASYYESKDKDFVVLFNSGGWGWKGIENSTGWESIYKGIEGYLTVSGYEPVMLNYRRTVSTLQGCIDEVLEMLTGYSSKTRELATRVEFLTRHDPDMKVILAGESNGSVISDSTMNALEYNTRVYSIQTGPPFWHGWSKRDRILVLTDNGIVPDSFSNGQIWTMIKSTIKTSLGLNDSKDVPTKVFLFFNAPGHYYEWEYPEVYARITGFMKENFNREW